MNLQLTYRILVCIVFALAPQVRAQENTENENSVKPGINKNFLDPDLDIDQWLGRFEVESREVYSARERVLAECKIEPGSVVADIGAGTGFYSCIFSAAVGQSGWVYAVDISPKFLQHINEKAQESDASNLTAVLGSERSIRLPPNSVDLAFVCDTYHHFEYPKQTVASIFRAIKPGGTLVVIDFERIPGKSREFILGHVRAGKEVFRKEIEQVGFTLESEVNIPSFEENYFLRFRKSK